MRYWLLAALCVGCSSTAHGAYEADGRGDDGMTAGAAGFGGLGEGAAGAGGFPAEDDGGLAVAGAAGTADAGLAMQPDSGVDAADDVEAEASSIEGGSAACSLEDATERLAVRDLGVDAVSLGAFRYEEQSECIECRESPCAVCDLLWLDTLYSDGVTLAAQSECPQAVFYPGCGSSLCGAPPLCTLRAKLDVVPEGDGWRVVTADVSASNCRLPDTICGESLPFGYEDVMSAAIQPSWQSQIEGLYLPCPES